jgi:hypothetical protein
VDLPMLQRSQILSVLLLSVTACTSPSFEEMTQDEFSEATLRRVGGSEVEAPTLAGRGGFLGMDRREVTFHCVGGKSFCDAVFTIGGIDVDSYKTASIGEDSLRVRATKFRPDKRDGGRHEGPGGVWTIEARIARSKLEAHRETGATLKVGGSGALSGATLEVPASYIDQFLAEWDAADKVAEARREEEDARDRAARLKAEREAKTAAELARRAEDEAEAERKRKRAAEAERRRVAAERSKARYALRESIAKVWSDMNEEGESYDGPTVREILEGLDLEGAYGAKPMAVDHLPLVPPATDPTFTKVVVNVRELGDATGYGLLIWDAEQVVLGDGFMHGTAKTGWVDLEDFAVALASRPFDPPIVDRTYNLYRDLGLVVIYTPKPSLKPGEVKASEIRIHWVSGIMPPWNLGR